MNLENFFNPNTVAVIGASSDKSKVGYAIMANLVAGQKRTILPISLNEGEILGLKVYKSIKEIPAENNIDLAVIAVRADIVPQILIECGERGIKTVIVISAGFQEIGEKGKELQDKIKEISDKYSIALLGPNCLGTIDTHNDLNCSFGTKKPVKGGIAFLSQSGALGTSLLDKAIQDGIGFSKFISLGNEAKLTEIDFLEYLAKDPETTSILIYLEKLSDGKKFMELAMEITKTKPIVVLKAGRSARGMEAVMSHTGSLAPEDSVFSGALKQCGVIAVESIREFFNLARLFHLGITKPLGIFSIITNGGGPSVVAADLVDLSRSLSLARFEEETKEALKNVLPSMASINNPIDMIGDALSDRYEKTLEIICNEKVSEAIILMLTPQMMTEVEATAKLISKFRDKKPIVPVFIGGPSILPALEYMKQNNLVNFPWPKDAVEALDNLALGMKKKSNGSHMANKDTPHNSKMMEYTRMSHLLNEYSIPFLGILMKNKSEIVGAISRLGNGPYAMKVISPEIVHKTDAGAVTLHINGVEEANHAWDKMEKRVKGDNPSISIEGYTIQRMGIGREVILGMKRDPVFGPVILFGLGGILAEALNDTTIRIAPINKEEALNMMQSIKGIKILNGMRGEKAIDFDSLANIVVDFSRMVLEHPEIREIDLNPIMVTDSKIDIVDCRMTY